MLAHSAFILDLDGVVYVGPDAVAHAIDALNAAHERGVRLTAATNNANRPAPDVAAHLQQLGLRIAAADVVTSAQAAAAYLARTLPAGAAVLAVGGEGVAVALAEVGLLPVRAQADLAATERAVSTVSAVMQGYGPGVAWHDLAAVHWAIARGLPWIATNTDSTVPTPFGRAPGNGSLVRAIEHASGVQPVVIGKPQPALFEAALERIGHRNALVIGDRLDTDIDGAAGCALDALMVFTGVHGFAELVGQPLARWPQFLAADLRSLTGPAVQVNLHDGVAVATGDAADAPFVLDTVRAIQCALDGFGEVPVFAASAAPAPIVDLRALLAEFDTVRP